MRARRLLVQGDRNLKLSQVLVGRGNNLNLLRFLAAAGVLVSHAVALTTGDADREPGRSLLGMTPGDMAVDLFFLVSGLLVTRSMLERASLAEFLRSRGLRIYPGLLVMLALTVGILCPIVYHGSPASFFEARATWRYVFYNVVLLRGVVFDIPGVFETVPWKGTINGSLWTLTWELRCYVGVALGWWATRWAGARTDGIRLGLACGVAMLAAGLHLSGVAMGEHAPFSRLVMFFAFGACAWFFRERIELSWKGAGAVAAVLLGCALLGQDAFRCGWALASPYLMLFLAFVPSGPVRSYNRFGDYSYGLYIYAFPVQQAWLAFMPDRSLAFQMAATAATSLCLAVLSWHLIEKPALQLRR